MYIHSYTTAGFKMIVITVMRIAIIGYIVTSIWLSFTASQTLQLLFLLLMIIITVLITTTVIHISLLSLLVLHMNIILITITCQQSSIAMEIHDCFLLRNDLVPIWDFPFYVSGGKFHEYVMIYPLIFPFWMTTADKSPLFFVIYIPRKNRDSCWI
jgi:hypothetical protein